MKEILLLLYMLLLLCLPSASLDMDRYKKLRCDPDVRATDVNGSDYIIGAIFPASLLSSSGLYNTNYIAVQWVSAMLYALDEINKNSTLLPGVKLGYDIRDSCNEVELATKYSLGFMVDKDLFVNGQSILAGVIGGSSSPVSTIMNTILSSDYIPEISYSSSSAILSSRKYRSFLRTVPSDKHQAAAIVDLIRFFGWTYVSAFAIDDDYGRVGLEELQKVTQSAGICLAHAQTFGEKMPAADMENIMGHLQDLSENSHIVIIWAPFNSAEVIISEAARRNISNIMYIGTEKWGEVEQGRIEKLTSNTPAIVLELGQPTLENSFIKKMSADLTINWKNPWFRYIFQSVFKNGCPEFEFFGPNKPPNCFYSFPPQVASVVIVKTRKKYPQVIAAVYAFAFGLHEYLKCSGTVCQKLGADGFDYKMLYETIRKCDFNVPGSKSPPDNEPYHISFDPVTGEIVNKMYLYNMYYNLTGHKRAKPFGKWTGKGDVEDFDESMIDWGPKGKPSGRCSVNCLPGTYRLNGSSSCCWKCLTCTVNKISTRINQYYCRRCNPDYEVANNNKTSCIQLREIRITLEDYIGLMLLSSCIVGVLITLFIIAVFVRYWETPVIKSSSREISIIQLLSLMLLFCLPVLYFFELTPLLCMFRTLVFGFLLTTVVSIILVKTYRLIRVFGTRFTKVSKFLQNKFQILFIYILVVFEIIAVLLWNWNFPPETLRDVRKKQLLFYITCDRHQIVIFWIVMLYVFVLTMISGYYAFRARKLPENYNEAQYISLAMFTAIVVWVAYVPLFFSLSPNENNIAFLFQNFVCTLAITLILYSYKVYVILFNSELNSPEHARQQHKEHFMDSLHKDMWRRQNSPPESEPFRPRLASLPALPVAVHPTSVFDDDQTDAGPANSPERRSEKTRLIDRVQPRRASFSSMSQLEKLHKSYDTFRQTDSPSAVHKKREIKKSQSTPFLGDESPPTNLAARPPGAANRPFTHFSFGKVLSSLSINKLLDHHRKSETRSLLESESDELNTRL